MWHYLPEFDAPAEEPVGGEKYPPPLTTWEILYSEEIGRIATKTTSTLIVNDLTLADNGTVECLVGVFRASSIDDIFLVLEAPKSVPLTVLSE